MKARRLVIGLALSLGCALGAAGCDDGSESELPLAPQLVPHVNPINLCEVPAGNLPQQLVFDLMLFNRGQQQLQITKLDVESDRRCTFTDTETTHYGDVRLYDDDPADEFLATAKSREAAFVRVRYSPPPNEPGEDEITIRIHSNAENFPEPDGAPVYVCAAGTANPEASCRIRMDPECNDATAAAATPSGGCDVGNESQVADPCPAYCQTSGAECRLPTLADPVGLPCPEGDYCQAPYYCVPDEGTPDRGTCMCRPCAVPPDEGWDSCPGA